MARSATSRLRRWLLVLPIAFGLLVAVLAGGLAWLSTGSGQAFLFARIEALATDATGWQLRLSEPSLALSGRLSFASLTLAEGEEPWLVVRDAEIRVRPLALLAGRLHVENSRIGEISLLREPRTQPTSEEAPSGPLELPQPPLRIRVDGLTLDRISVAEAVFGKALELTARFRLNAQPGGDTTLDVAFNDSADRLTRLTGAAVLSADEKLAIRARFTDHAGGLLATVLQQPDLPQVDLALDGSGRLGDWSGSLQLDAPDLAGVKASFAADLRDFTNVSLDADGTAASRLFALFGLAGLPELRFDAALRRHDGGKLTLTRFVLDSGQSELVGQGDIALPDGPVNLSFNGKLAGADWRALLPPELALDDADLELDLGGTLPQPAVRADITVRGAAWADLASSDGLHCTLDATASTGLESVGYTGRCAASGLAMQGPAGALLGPGPELAFAGAVEPATTRLQLDSFDLTGAALSASLQGTATLPDIDVGGRAKIADLAALDPALAGALQLSLTAKGQVEGPLDGRLDWSTVGLQAGGDPLAAALARDLKGGADIRLSAGQVLKIDALEAASRALSLTGSAELALKTLQFRAKASARVPETQKLPLPEGVKLDGAASMSLEASGTPARARLSANAKGPDLVAGGTEVTGPTVWVQAEAIDASVKATVEATAAAAGEPARLATQLRLDGDGGLRLDGIDGRMFGASLQGNVVGSLQRNLWDGTLDLSVPDLAPLGRFAGLTLSGLAGAKLALSHAGGRQHLGLGLGTRDVVLAQDGTEIRFGPLRLQAGLDDVFGKPAILIELSLGRTVTPQAELKSFTLAASGSLDAIAVQARAEAEAGLPVTAGLGGTLRLRDDAVSFDLAALQATAGELVARLQAPTSLSLQGEAMELAPTRLVIGKGSVSLSARRDAQSMAASLKVADVPLAEIGKLATAMPVEGTLAGVASLDWQPGRQDFDMHWGATGLRFPELDAALPEGAVVLDGRWDGQAFKLDGEISGFTETPGKLTAALPLRAGETPATVELPEEGAIAGSFRWQGEVAPVMALLPLSEHRLSGRAGINLKAAGTVAAPRLAGEASLQGGRYEHLTLGTILQDIEVEAKGNEAGSLSLTGTAGDGSGGTLQLAGEARLTGGQGPGGSVTLKLGKLTAMRRDDLLAVVSADLSAGGNAKRAEATGEITVERLEFNIPDRLPPSVTELEVREVGGTDEAAAAAEAEPPPPGPVTDLDLKVSLPGQVFVRGRGLESEWRGDLTIKGTAAEPRIEGTLSVVRGNISFAGRTLEISEGRIRFLGGRDIDPLLDLVIEHSRSDINAKIALVGPVSKPELKMSSTPTLPDDEILARVVFGKSVRELSPVQALQLSQSIGQLTGKLPSGGGILDKARKLIGADVLTVEGDDATGPQLGVGKYLSEDFYVGVRQGAKPGSSALSAEMKLTPELSLQSDVGVNATGNVNLNWSLDY